MKNLLLSGKLGGSAEEIIIKSLILCALSLTLSYVLIPLCRALAEVMGAEDMPDGVRRINTERMPRLGGLGFFVAFSAVLLIGGMLGDSTVNALIIGGGIIVAAGVSDDVFSLTPGVKLALQLAAAFVALTFIEIPDRFSFFGLVSLSLTGILGAAFAMGRIVFSVNAVNFSDGLDGLAAGLSVTALTALFLFGLSNERYIPAISALLLAFAVLGFLPYNKYRAKIFMGDSGSQFLGFAIALLSLGCSADGAFTAQTSLFLAVPLIDTWFSVTRRILHGKSPFSADKGHLHHLLLSLGISHPTAVKILVSLGAVVALMTLLFSV